MSPGKHRVALQLLNHPVEWRSSCGLLQTITLIILLLLMLTKQSSDEEEVDYSQGPKHEPGRGDGQTTDAFIGVIYRH